MYISMTIFQQFLIDWNINEFFGWGYLNKDSKTLFFIEYGGFMHVQEKRIIDVDLLQKSFDFIQLQDFFLNIALPLMNLHKIRNSKKLEKAFKERFNQYYRQEKLKLLI